MNTKYIIPIAASACLATALCVSCNDEWDDHYEVASEGVNSGTLWDAINADDDLSNFASVTEACGYDINLSGSQTFTVFVPTNSYLTSSQVDSLVSLYNEESNSGVQDDENSVVKQFVQNHISLYKHSVSSSTSDSITMMNGKYQELTTTSIGGETLLSTNELYENGLLFTIGGQIDYNPNVLEYLGMDDDLDSVYQFINSFGTYEFQADQSVAGEIIDGKTHYLDSVTTYKNDILSTYGYINNEDSCYWFLAPTNSEWDRLVEEYTEYFNYATSVDDYDSLQYTNTRLAIIGGAFFNKSDNPDAAIQDSVVSTSAKRQEDDEESSYYKYFRPYDEGGIFDDTEDIELSNGHVLKASDFRITKYETFFQEKKVEAETLSQQDTLLNAVDPVTVRTVSSDNPFYDLVSDNSYAEVVPSSTSVNPIVSYKISDLLSNIGYDIYIVFAPALAYDTLATDEQRLPNRFLVRFEYTRANGNSYSEQLRTTFTTTPDVVDTVLVSSDYSFPTSTYDLSEDEVKVRIQSSVSSSQTSSYSRTMRIDCIIFKPHEDDEAEAKTYRIR